MFQRKTQTAEYWGATFRFSEEDVLHLYETLMDRGVPCSTDDLVLALIDFRCQQEEAYLRAELSKGTLYQPKEDYEIGQRLVFAAFDFAVGTVVEKRAGRNPEHGEFNVIAVQFEGQPHPREFAAALQTPHKLNLDDGRQALLEPKGLLSPAELKETVAADLGPRLAAYLETMAGDSFVQSDGRWLLRGLLADVNIGHLNIAEALIEVENRPLPAQRLLEELHLPAEIPAEIALFSLNYALEHDERFDDLGAAGERLWYLRRLEPEAALVTPAPLRYTPQPYDRLLLSMEWLSLEWELGDEWSEEVVEIPVQAPSVTMVLTYPHRRAGTLPLSFRTRPFFPPGERGRGMVTLIDGRWGRRFNAMVVYERRYVVGLGDWFEQHNVPVGAYIVLERGKEPGEVVVDIRPRRMRREWMRLGRVEADQLVFEMRKLPVSCEYDELMVMDALDPVAVDDLREKLSWRDVPLATLLDRLLPELLKLSPEGKVHSKTVYSAVNMVRRCPPGPIFATLLSSRRYRHVGDGFWALA
ncbi:MAG: hypothetical protein QHJ81_03865 [Anaerolineae bacterium]|nr:hypothetical protein [Anaerolineae bacterium]